MSDVRYAHLYQFSIKDSVLAYTRKRFVVSPTLDEALSLAKRDMSTTEKIANVSFVASADPRNWSEDVGELRCV